MGISPATRDSQAQLVPGFTRDAPATAATARDAKQGGDDRARERRERRMRKQRLTLNEHKALGAELKAIHSQLVRISVTVGRAYPLQGRATRQANAAHEAVSGLRCWLEEEMLRDHPDLGNDSLRIYYGGSDE
jgi:hypothetical protein